MKLLECRDRIGAAADRGEDDAAIVERLHELRPLREHGVELRERVEIVAGLVQRGRVVGAHVGVAGIERERALIVAGRLIELARIEVHARERDECGEVVRDSS